MDISGRFVSIKDYDGALTRTFVLLNVNIIQRVVPKINYLFRTLKIISKFTLKRNQVLVIYINPLFNQSLYQPINKSYDKCAI